ncbi:hypothetical protein [Mucilaginibacter sp. UYCu711]|uniref:hypothetical protein n=1 Tax=Mucilaginibacter sp. UYCu711 TaxID=3156339 RepID=UPI003D19B3D7
MTLIELRTEIQKALDNVPENVLQSVLDYLKQAQAQSPDQIRRDNNFKKILAEDKELLKRLAK